MEVYMFSKSEFHRMYDDFLECAKSNENLELKNIFKFECGKLSSIAKSYWPNCNIIYSDLLSKTSRREYSVGGELLDRGFYCPSPIRDIVTGNCPRGRLYKKLTSRCRPSYEYYFDENDKLILIHYLYSDCVEFLDYKENTVVGITFSKTHNNIVKVVECEYDNDGRIVSFIIGRSSYSDCLINELEKELYFYNNGLEETEIFHYLCSEQSELLNYEKYKFYHDDEGYLVKYKPVPSMLDLEYKVYVKRRV